VHAVAPSDSASKIFAPTILTQTTDTMRVMQEEIFGPILPIKTYQLLDDAVQYVRAQPRPLAFYLFDNNSARINQVLNQVVAGGVCVNDVALHFAIPTLPFGGVGPSGMGSYHGEFGFKTFSQAMPVFRQGFWSGIWMIKPPYKGWINKAIGFLTK
jgi:coniferyl-aldehyde dehydrogenase